MKKLAMGALLLFPNLWLGIACSAEPDSTKLIEERTRQEKIFRSTNENIADGYTVDRSLADYSDALPADFERRLATLGPRDRWLDIGAGRGQAILDYYNPSYDQSHPEGRERRGTKAQAVAISIEDRRTPLWHQTATSLGANQIQYFFDKRFRDYSLGELGRFQVITDLLGGFSYTEDLATFMEKALGFLELNGIFYTLLQDVKSEAGTNQPYYANSPYLTELANADDSELKVCAWLKSISCVEVSCELRPRWKPPIEVYRILKVCEKTSVPALVRMHYAAGTPPERRYRLRN